MSILKSACCACGSCFFGVRSADPDDSDFGQFVACRHNITEKLELKIPRPAHTSGVSHGGIIQGLIANPPCPCIGNYKLFAYSPASPDINVHYEHFQYRNPNRVYTWRYEPVHSGGVLPPCSTTCCGYNTTTDNDVICCDPNQGYYCNGGGYRIPQANGQTKEASHTQRQLITDGFIPEKIPPSAAAGCDFGDQYFFLQGICNYSPSVLFKHWVWNASTGEIELATPRTLERTMLCVVHKEKWWQRFYNSMRDTTSVPPPSTSDQNTGSDRTPKWWLFACSGIPLFTWEIMELSSLSDDDKKDLFSGIANGTYVKESIFDTLEADGILEIKDHGRTDGKLIKKTMRAASSSIPDTTKYFYARPGGWDFVCLGFSSNGDANGLEADWPQISRRFRSDSTDSCFTGAPIPTNGQVASQTFAPATPGDSACDLVTGGCDNLPVNCDCGAFSFCGSPDPENCLIDTIVGNCKGCWIQHIQYASTATQGVSSCNGVFNSFLCRVPDLSTQCDFGELPNEITHQIPYVVSKLGRQSPPVSTILCCDGTASLQYGLATCPASRYDSTETCAPPEEWGECLVDPLCVRPDPQSP